MFLEGNAAEAVLRRNVYKGFLMNLCNKSQAASFKGAFMVALGIEMQIEKYNAA